jgi:hypothetical protein
MLPFATLVSLQKTTSWVYVLTPADVTVAPLTPPVMTCVASNVPVRGMMMAHPAFVVSNTYPTISPVAPLDACVTGSPRMNVPVAATETVILMTLGPDAHHHAATDDSPVGYVSNKGDALPPHLSFVAVPVVSFAEPSDEALYVQPAAFMHLVRAQIPEKKLLAVPVSS